jgi:hypothetical protein
MENISHRKRRARAVKAATKIGATYGIKSDAPIVLKDSNNTIIHLAPSPVVAKVATSTLRKQYVSTLEHELNVALHLASSDAPIVPPSREPPPAVYRDGDLEVTFWQYCPGEVLEEIDHPELIAAVKAFHLAFANYRADSNLSPKNMKSATHYWTVTVLVQNCRWPTVHSWGRSMDISARGYKPSITSVSRRMRRSTAEMFYGEIQNRS